MKAFFTLVVSFVLSVLPMHAAVSKELTREQFVDRAIAAARSLADATSRNSKANSDERRNAQSQFAMLLYTAGHCDEAHKVIAVHSDVMAGSIERITLAAAVKRDFSCLGMLAPVLFERSDDSWYISAGRIANQLKAAAALDVIGDPSGWQKYTAAENELLMQNQKEVLWEARFRALTYYSGSPKLNRYLEHLADRLSLEKPDARNSTRRSLYAYFAFQKRCDLVRRVAEPALKDCADANKLAESIYIKTPDPGPFWTELASSLSETPPLTEAGIKTAIADGTVWGRLSRLLFMVKKARASESVD